MPAATHAYCPTPLTEPLSRQAPAIAAAGPAVLVISAEARRWFALAIGSLVIAGLLSLSVVIGRIPGLSGLIDDPLFFKRCLVVHVDLALIVWFYAFLGGLAAIRCGRDTGPIGRGAYVLSVAGTGAMLVGALMRGAQPVLANYVPVIDHPLFLGGLAAFFVGALVFLLETLATAAQPRPGGPTADSAAGFQAAAVAFVLAGVTWLATRAALPEGLDTWTRYEFSAWGAGHVLQVANAAAMLGVWLWLLARATGAPVLGQTAARVLFTVLLAPHFAMPLLTARGALDPLYHSGATQLMRWGIFPVVSVVLVLGLRHLWRHRGVASGDALAGAARAGFAASAGLTVLGFVLGACIRSSTTLVPAHYHASLGGVTVAFMAAAYLVCAAAKVSHPLAHARSSERERVGGGTPALPARSARRQLIAFGVGQAVFALGFAIGGAYGLGRKAYAGEQHVRSAGELVGLGVMGLGGLVATAAGLWFLFLVLREMRGWWARRAAGPKLLLQSIP
jgi:cytochrome c oxidase subunit I